MHVLPHSECWRPIVSFCWKMQCSTYQHRIITKYWKMSVAATSGSIYMKIKIWNVIHQPFDYAISFIQQRSSTRHGYVGQRRKSHSTKLSLWCYTDLIQAAREKITDQVGIGCPGGGRRGWANISGDTSCSALALRFIVCRHVKWQTCPGVHEQDFKKIYIYKTF